MSRKPKAELCGKACGVVRCSKPAGHSEEQHSCGKGTWVWIDGQEEPTKLHQCPSMYVGRGVGIFCLKKEKHTGDHRGGGKQWNDKGEAVKISEPLPI